MSLKYVYHLCGKYFVLKSICLVQVNLDLKLMYNTEHSFINATGIILGKISFSFKFALLINYSLGNCKTTNAAVEVQNLGTNILCLCIKILTWNLLRHVYMFLS